MDEEKLISKKEVLERMGISYGQLYRWKRKGLIPESWFIRRSTFTGQETFFPQEKILERIGRIMDLKDDYPLDELATLITKRVNEKLAVAFSKLQKLGWLDEQLIEICNLKGDEEATLPLEKTFCIGVLRQLEKGAAKEEIALVKQTLDSALAEDLIERVRGEKLLLHLLHKRLSAAGISAEISLVVIAADGATFDPDIEVVQTIDLGTVLERIKLELVNEKESLGKEEENLAKEEQ